ncbi:MAG: hypothetical protein AB7U45_08450 [Desulfamplus sp.]
MNNRMYDKSAELVKTTDRIKQTIKNRRNERMLEIDEMSKNYDN